MPKMKNVSQHIHQTLDVWALSGCSGALLSHVGALLGRVGALRPLLLGANQDWAVFTACLALIHTAGGCTLFC